MCLEWHLDCTVHAKLASALYEAEYRLGWSLAPITCTSSIMGPFCCTWAFHSHIKKCKVAEAFFMHIQAEWLALRNSGTCDVVYRSSRALTIPAMSGAKASTL